MRSRLVDVLFKKEIQDESVDQKIRQRSARPAWSQAKAKKFFARQSRWQWAVNVPMMKFLLDRILPKERPIQLELPDLDYAHDSVDAMAEIVNAVSSGRISPREGADVAQLVSSFITEFRPSAFNRLLWSATKAAVARLIGADGTEEVNLAKGRP
jgi:hypothetical protein